MNTQLVISITALVCILIFGILTAFFYFHPINFDTILSIISQTENNNVTIYSAIIGATGSIIGGIIGGIITGVVAFKVANYQIKKDAETKEKEYLKLITNYKKMVLNEVATNSLLLSQIDEDWDESQLSSILKYSLNTSIFESVAPQLPHDDFFVELHYYYTIINRLQKDPELLEAFNYDSLHAEIINLKDLQKKLESL